MKMDGFRILNVFVGTLLCAVYFVSAYDPATCIQCRKSHVCNPPDCFCCRDTMPLESKRVPQMVFFTFDDAVNPTVAKHYKDLFDSSRLNPNGCPIRMTLFISHRNTLYSYVRDFYEQGMEIASHSVTHSHPNAQTFLREAKKQKENLARKANIPESEIVGWRSPFLEPLGDTQPAVLKELGYTYDATLTMTKKGSLDKAITPFTLDHGWPYDCKIKPCPAESHSGFWEVPVVSVKDYKNKYDCVYIDACHSPPPSEKTAYQFLWDNFQRYYSTNRAPMGINMHASWFEYPDRKAAMHKFIKQLITMDDVYIVTIKQVIEWLKQPTALDKIKTFKPWQCDGGGNETIGVAEAKQTPQTKVITNQDLKTQQQFTLQQVQQQTNAPMQTNVPVQTNAQMHTNNWQVRQNRMQNNVLRRQQNNVMTRQPISPSAVPFHTPPAMQTPIWTQNNMNGLPAIPNPPMSPNFPAIRFWWRPPNIMDPQMQIEMRRREAIQRQRMVQQQQQQQQQSAMQHAQLQREKRQQDIVRQELIEKQRQQIFMQQKAEEDRLRKEQLEKIRQEEVKRQQLLEQKQLETKIMEEKKRQERLRQEQLEKEKQEELKRQALIQQKQLQKQLLEEKLRQEQIKQEQLEKQKQIEIQQQIEKQRLAEQLQQERQQQEELKRHEQLRQEQLEKQKLEEQRQKKIAKQKHDELRRRELMQKQYATQQTLGKFPYNQKEMIGNQNIQMAKDINFSTKLDELLIHNKRDRIDMLQKLSLHELQLLQYEVNQRMTNVPLLKATNDSLQELNNNVKQDVKGVVKQKEQHILQNNVDTNSISSANDTYVDPLVLADSSQDIYSAPLAMPETSSQTVISQSANMDATTTPPSQETTNIATTHLPLQKSTLVTNLANSVQQIIATEEPKETLSQRPIPFRYVDTTTPSVESFNSQYNKVNDVPFFNFIPPKLSSFEHQPGENSLTKNPDAASARKSVWQMDTFDIKSLSGPWKREPIPTSPKPDVSTKNPVRRKSLKFLPVAITLFNTNSFQQPKPRLSYRAFVRPNLFSPENSANKNVSSDNAVPVSRDQFQTARNTRQENALRFSEPYDVLPAGFKRIEPEHSTTVRTTTSTTTTTQSTTTTPITTITTSTSSTTTIPPPTTTTALPTTTSTSVIKTTTSPTPISSYSTTRGGASVLQKQIVPENPAFTHLMNSRTLLPIPTHWKINGNPIVIPPYGPSISSPSPQLPNDTTQGCHQGVSCVLPNCFCKTELTPLGMKLTDIPQIVYITIDGSLNFHSLSKIRKLFSGRTNPNGCKIRGTMFITDAGSSYRITDLLRRDGIELAMMGMNSRPYTNTEQLKADIPLQRQRIAESSNIPRDSIEGWRSPGFQTLGDDHYDLLKNESLYDSSLVLDRSSSDQRKIWPFTLDFGLNEPCEISLCPYKHHPGLWEFPVIPFRGPNNSAACEYTDGCAKQPTTAEDTFDYLMDNFNMYYKTNRAPFAIRLKQIWFHGYYRENLKGLFNFLDTVLGNGDVYVSSISDMLQWIKKPIKLQNIASFTRWNC